jgi:hypothetical protein
MKSLSVVILAVPSNLIVSGIPYRSVPNLGIGYSEKHGIPRKELCFPRNNGKRSESICGDFCGTEFSATIMHTQNAISVLK